MTQEKKLATNLRKALKEAGINHQDYSLSIGKGRLILKNTAIKLKDIKKIIDTQFPQIAQDYYFEIYYSFEAIEAGENQELERAEAMIAEAYATPHHSSQVLYNQDNEKVIYMPSDNRVYFYNGYERYKTMYADTARNLANALVYLNTHVA